MRGTRRQNMFYSNVRLWLDLNSGRWAILPRARNFGGAPVRDFVRQMRILDGKSAAATWQAALTLACLLKMETNRNSKSEIAVVWIQNWSTEAIQLKQKKMQWYRLEADFQARTWKSIKVYRFSSHTKLCQGFSRLIISTYSLQAVDLFWNWLQKP